ncbi:HNH endonuclease [Lentzea indica]|uniref:HNH endonuclease n=1 Tax=Lentzea indica TaxID=2604800 RepID=UPI0035E42F70
MKEVTGRHDRLACEVCTFDFKQTYGDRGAGFAEIHHAVPFHVTGPIKTRLADLVVLCSNCHRMIHRGPQWFDTSGAPFVDRQVTTCCVAVIPIAVQGSGSPAPDELGRRRALHADR